MKKKSIAFKILVCTILALAGVVIFFSCSKKGSEGKTTSLPPVSSVSSAASSSASSSSVSSQSPTSSFPKLDDESIPPPAHSKAPVTSDEDFNKVFASNPIDKAYSNASKEAETTKDMVALISKFITIWDQEIDYAYKNLLTLTDSSKRAAVEKEQTEWRSKLDASVQQIKNSVDKDKEGSNYPIASGAKVMEYYKARAIALYQQIYAYNTNLTYGYKG